jgi:hypothetical protein
MTLLVSRQGRAGEPRRGAAIIRPGRRAARTTASAGRRPIATPGDNVREGNVTDYEREPRHLEN